MLEHLEGISCLRCGSSFRPSLRQLCSKCDDGGQLRYRYLLSRFDGQALRRDWSRREPWLWRFRELLPLDETTRPPPLQVGHTPLYGSARLATFVGVHGLLIKDESRQPTGRSADRAAAMLVAFGSEHEAGIVTGPLAASMAPFAASAGAPLLALLPESSSPARLEAFGVSTLRLASPLDVGEALRIVHRESGRFFGDRPNPLAFEGLKTLGLELGEQLAERMPQWIALDGSEVGLVDAVSEGLSQLSSLGLFHERPKLLSVNGPGGDVEIQTSPAEISAAARAIPPALGLWIDSDSDGAVALAGLKRAVEQAKVPESVVALVVLQGAQAPQVGSFPQGEVVRDFDGLRARLHSH
jgi:threonine synthase